MKEMKITPPDGYEIDKEKSTFENIVFKKKDSRPMSWGEYCQAHKDKWEWSTGNVKFGVPKGFADVPQKYIDLRKLELLRDAWNEGVEFDWKHNAYFSIIIDESQQKTPFVAETVLPRFLHFRYYGAANLFLKTFKDLIEEARDLL